MVIGISSSNEWLNIWEMAALVVVVIVVVSICFTVVMPCSIFWWRKKNSEFLTDNYWSVNMLLIDCCAFLQS